MKGAVDFALPTFTVLAHACLLSVREYMVQCCTHSRNSILLHIDRLYTRPNEQ